MILLDTTYLLIALPSLLVTMYFLMQRARLAAGKLAPVAVPVKSDS